VATTSLPTKLRLQRRRRGGPSQGNEGRHPSTRVPQGRRHFDSHVYKRGTWLSSFSTASSSTAGRYSLREDGAQFSRVRPSRVEPRVACMSLRTRPSRSLKNRPARQLACLFGRAVKSRLRSCSSSCFRPRPARAAWPSAASCTQRRPVRGVLRPIESSESRLPEVRHRLGPAEDLFDSLRIRWLTE